MTTSFITLSQACAHLRVDLPSSDDDSDIQDKMDQACDIIRDYLHVHDSDYTGVLLEEGTAPPRVVAAALLVLGELYRNRENESDPISPGVVRLLSRTRDPVVA